MTTTETITENANLTAEQVTAIQEKFEEFLRLTTTAETLQQARVELLREAFLKLWEEIFAAQFDVGAVQKVLSESAGFYDAIADWEQ